VEINPVSAKRMWTKTQRIAHHLREREWERGRDENFGFVAFLEGDSRRAAIKVGEAFNPLQLY